MFPERRSVPDDDFARRVAALYGPDRAAVLFARWEKWREEGREADATRERDGLLRRMFDLGQFMKTVKELFHIRYCKAHGWEGTLWRGANVCPCRRCWPAGSSPSATAERSD